MNVIIPLAGFGTRLRPHTYTKPKPLINVAGKPVLGHILDKLTGLGIDQYVFVVGYLGDQIEEYIAAHYDIDAHYVEQRELLGQAHAIHLAKELVTGPTLILFVDTLFEADLSGLESLDIDGMAYVKEVDDPRRFGVVVLDDEGTITQFIEKPDTTDNRLVVIGLYYIREIERLMGAIEDLIARDIKTKGEFYLADAFQLMIENGAVMKTSNVDVWLDCGKPETVLETNCYLLEHGHDNGVKFEGKDVIVVQPAHIDASARIHNAVIGPYVTIAADCEVKNSIVRNSIVDEGARIEDSLLDGSLVGKNASVQGRFTELNVGDSSAIKLG